MRLFRDWVKEEAHLAVAGRDETRRRDADLLQVVPLELPGREALDMDVELVEAGVVASQAN